MPIRTAEEWLGHRVGGRYTLERILSRGGMGVLYGATDAVSGASVAVKMIAPAHSVDPDRRSRFLREVRIASRISHENIAEVLDVCEEADGGPFLVMELLTGSTLAERLVAEPVLTFEEARTLLTPIMRALAAAHEHGVIHRDVKPSNIFLCRGPRSVTPKLLDFGIARVNELHFETQSGLVLGTPGYMAPEQCELGECGPTTDVWGMAAVFYRCLAGRVPHEAETVPQLIAKLVRESVMPLDVPGVPRGAAAVIDRALSREPHRRYATMQAFIEALERGATASAEPATVSLWAESTPHGVPMPAPASPVKPRRTRALVVAALALVSVTAGAAFFLGSQRSPALAHDAHGASPHARNAGVATSMSTLVANHALPVPQTPDVAARGPEKSADFEPKRRTRSRPAPVQTKARAETVAPPKSGSVGRLGDAPAEAPRPAVHSLPAPRPVEREPSGLPVVTEW